MEDVLETYARAYDPTHPVVCFDESPYQLVSEVRQRVAATSGQPARIDDEYKRCGTCNLFLLFEPQYGWRQVTVTTQRTAADFALQMRDLVDTRYPTATQITVVLDNLNTHTPASLYEVFPPAEARRILAKLHFCYTPKHGSWLNMAETEFAALRGQCLDQRIATIATVQRKAAAWATRRNAAHTTVKWCFTLEKARTTLERLYPS